MSAIDTQSILEQFELVIGASPQAFPTDKAKGKSVWVGAPTASHPKGAENGDPVLIGLEGSADAAGFQTLETSDFRGFILPVGDVAKLEIRGTVGDAVEVAILR